MDTEQAIPGIDSWIRVNLSSDEDLKRVREFAYPEDYGDVLALSDEYSEQGVPRVVVYNAGQHTLVTPEKVFEFMYLNADEGIDETSLAVGEMAMYELESDSDRLELSKWATYIVEGTDTLDLNRRVRVGDLIVYRPGAGGFEVFRRAEYSNQERVQARLAILNLGVGIEKAKELDSWVHGDMA